ncbi:MAG: hypothetical protein ACE37H_03460 [Phycisphaeraceae bacterium]
MTEPTLDRIDDWINRYLDGQIGRDEFDLLWQAMRRDPAVLDRFVELAMLDRAVSQTLRHNERVALLRASQHDPGEAFESALSSLWAGSDAAPIIRLERDDRRAPAPRRWLLPATVAAALVLAAALVAVLVPGHDQAPRTTASPQGAVIEPEPAAMQLTAERGARWLVDGVPQRLEIDHAVRAGQRVTLMAGFAEFTTPTGAKAILEAPCTLEPLANKHTLRLHRGKLVGICPTPESRGLTIETRDARIIDVGTRFGVAYDGQTLLRVIEGEVRAHARASDASDQGTRLIAGQSAGIDARSGKVDPSVDTRALRFVADWSAINNPPQVSGDALFNPAIHPDLRAGHAELNTIQLFPERTAVRLLSDTAVTLAEPGEYNAFAGLSSLLPAGVLLDSYFIHADPLGQPAGEQSQRYQATIRFDRPILAVIATSEHLKQSHAALGLPGLRYGSADAASRPDGFDPSGLEASSATGLRDRVEISEDRRTLTLELFSGEAIDQLRVLVEAGTP